MGLLMCSSIEYVEGVIRYCSWTYTEYSYLAPSIIVLAALLSHDLSLLIACTSIPLCPYVPLHYSLLSAKY